MAHLLVVSLSVVRERPGGTPQPAGTGIDGTGGEQPRFTTIAGNIIHELGHYQKQSSMVFQAQSCQTTITNNIFYNGPRANINFNDQFGGDNVMANNLVFNSCRETADHGPFNSWGRQLYITKVRDGVTPSITPAFTTITKNFIISTLPASVMLLCRLSDLLIPDCNTML